MNDKKNPFAWPEGPITIKILALPPPRFEVPQDFKTPLPKCILCEIGVPKRPPRKDGT